MSAYRHGAANLAKKASKSASTNDIPVETKDLPLGKTGPRWKSGHRLSLKITKPREARQVLKENQVRYEARQVLRAKLGELLKEGQQKDKFPFPRHKEDAKKPIDWRHEHKVFHINPKTVEIEEKDLYQITPELLPMLANKIRDMRAAGHSWEHISLAVVFQYTAHLKDPSDKALKRGLVKNELRRVWDEEVAVQRSRGETPSATSDPFDEHVMHATTAAESANSRQSNAREGFPDAIKSHLQRDQAKL